MKVLKSAWKFLLLIILIGFGILYYASNKVDEKYHSAIVSMNNGEWSKAVSIILETPHYKDSSELYIYMYPHKLFYSEYTTESDAIKGYTSAVEFINQEIDKLTGTASEKYVVDLKELGKVLNFKIKELNAKILDEPLKKNLDESVDLIIKGSYQEALLKLQGIGDNSIYGTDKQELVKYITLQSIIPNNDINAITKAIAELNPNYTGALSQEIKLTANTYVDIVKWNEIYNAKKDGGLNNNQVANSPQSVQKPAGTGSKSLTTGMTREEVVLTLGNPSTSNKISNKYGNYEEMIYGSNKIVYLENNIVAVAK